MVKKNKGFTLVELIVVLCCFTMVAAFFWAILNSSSEDSYTLTEKVEVQTSVTSLMNIIEQDIQEAKVYNLSATEKGIVIADEEAGTYELSDIVYSFDKDKRIVTRTQEGASVTYNDIVSFSMIPVSGEKYGAKVSIVGGKEPEGDALDKSRYTLSTTYYSRNTQ